MIVGVCVNLDVFIGFCGFGSRVLFIVSVFLFESIKEFFFMCRWGVCNGVCEFVLWCRGI